MQTTGDPAADLRRLSVRELIQAGEDSLREHLLAQAVVARHKHSPLTLAQLDAFLQDPECLRYPTRLAFAFGSMALHQFAQPEIDSRAGASGGRVLYLRPLLRDHPRLILLAVAYMIPVINYGDIITDQHCLAYGATLLGLPETEYYQQVCALADFVGAESRR